MPDGIAIMNDMGDRGWPHFGLAASLLIVVAATGSACSRDVIVDPAPSQVEPTGLDLAQQQCPRLPVLMSTANDTEATLVITDRTPTDRHIICVMKSLNAPERTIRQVDEARRAAQGSGGPVSHSGEWRAPRMEATYTFDYTVGYTSDRLTVTEHTS